jgi:hypothetical protein
LRSVKKIAPRPLTPAPGDIPAALDELGISFRIVDDNEAAFLCPYHDDHKVGSFSVNLETGQNNCFSCGAGGGFVRVVQTVLGISAGEADRWCRSRRMKGVGGSTLVTQDLRTRKSSGTVDTAKQINEASLALFTDPPASALAGTERWRGCSLDAARYYGVRWSPETGSWIVPIREPEEHRLIGWQEKNDRHFRNVPKGVDKSTALFGLESLDGARLGYPLVLVESPLDVPRLLTAGVRGGISSYGVHVSRPQLDILAGARARTLVLALDNDPAGSGEATRLVREFRRLRVMVFNYGRSRAKDPGAMTDTEIRWGIDNAIWAPLWRP